MGFTEKVYKYAPIILQNAMVSAYGLTWRKRRFGGIFRQELEGYKRRENFTAEQWYSYASQQLVKMLTHAYNTVPYYSEKWKQLGLSEQDIKNITPETIGRLPFLEKDDLRKFCRSSLLSETREVGGKFFASSGSTGTPTSILFSEPMHQRSSAGYEARVRNWAGVSRFEPRGMIGGRRVLPEGYARPPFYRYNIFEKQVYFSAYHISPQNVKNYLLAIEKYKLSYMVGYANSNFFLARFLEEQGLKAPQLKAVITSSEKLTSEMRDTFKRVYNCNTFDGWSGVESCGLISECEKGGLHISLDVGYLEILDENGNPAKPGEMGEVVCTGFINYDQPLIRYRIGDYVVPSAKKCLCGRHMPLVDEIVGRFEDVVIGKDGREMVRFHGIFINIPDIIQGQVVQEDIDNIFLNIAIASKLRQEDKDLLIKRVQSQLPGVNVTIVEMKDIPRGPNGKFRAVISKVKRVRLG
jgi:phenylacetate-CoA ligase